MTHFAVSRSAATAIASLALLFGTALAAAATPSDVSDLVGARGSSGEQELGSRGYDYVTMTKGTQYWWNAKRGACIGIKVAEGRYQSVTAAAATQCHQKSAKTESSGSGVSSQAVNACKSAVNRNFGGSAKISVTSTEFSQANSLVMMKVQGETWKCLVSNSGKVADLSVVGN